HHGLGALSGGACRHRLRPRGSPDLRRAGGLGKPGRRGKAEPRSIEIRPPTPRRGQPRSAPMDHGARVRSLPQAARAIIAPGRVSVRRRAADAHDRPHAHGQPRAPAARRTVGGAGAAGRGPPARTDRASQARGPHHPAGRAERGGLAGARPPRLRGGERLDPLQWSGGPPARRRSPPPRAPRAVEPPGRTWSSSVQFFTGPGAPALPWAPTSRRGPEGDMRIRFWGPRGSLPKPGRATVRYGGNPSCVEVRGPDNALIILDCGSGAHELGQHLVAGGRVRGHLLITHTHWDHIQGFPFFAPLFVPGNEWDVYGPRQVGRRIEEVLAGQMNYPYFPVPLETLAATIRYHELAEESLDLAGVRVTTRYLNHPSPAIGYRLQAGGV